MAETLEKAGGAGALPASLVNEGKEEKDELIIKLNKPYKFEGKEYNEIDLRGLRKLTIRDAIDAQKAMLNRNESAGMIVPETTTAFSRELAIKALKKPTEFLDYAPRGLSKKIVYAVRSVLNANSNTENHVMKFEKPYTFNGKRYTEIDLNGIANLNSLDESAAENRLASEGFVVTENTFNYLYACVIASFAVGKPEEFFTGLPICELIKLKNAVNDADFFE